MCIVCQNQSQPLSQSAQTTLHAALAAPSINLFPAGPTTADVMEIAEQLRTDYRSTGDKTRAFKLDVGTGGTINVDISKLTDVGKAHAIRAMDMWTLATGLKFDTNPDKKAKLHIDFDDDRGGAFAQYSVGGGSKIENAQVNVSVEWISTESNGIDSYSLQTYLHEIGHVLGLAHAGDYAPYHDYSTDTELAQDSWQSSVMSYYPQTSNPNSDASWAFAITPMLADIQAIQDLYGVVKTVGAGNTIYGIGSNAGPTHKLIGKYLETGTIGRDIAFTIIDRSGIDTLNFRTAVDDMAINLTPGSASNIYGSRENLMIERNTVIERVVAGTADDQVLGNKADNTVYGKSGADTLQGAAGRDTLFGGDDNDMLMGGGGRDNLRGGKGQDWLVAGAGRDVLSGGADADHFMFAAVIDSRVGHEDRIADFKRGSDLIDLSVIDAITGEADDQAFDFIGTRSFTAAGQLRITADRSGVYLKGDVDGDGRADFAIFVDDRHHLAARDFIL